jgi:hypothetical protein
LGIVMVSCCLLLVWLGWNTPTTTLKKWKWDVRTDIWYLPMLMSWFWCLEVSMFLRIFNIHTLSWIRGLWLHSRESLKPYMKACLSYHISIS